MIAHGIDRAGDFAAGNVARGGERSLDSEGVRMEGMLCASARAGIAGRGNEADGNVKLGGTHAC